MQTKGSIGFRLGSTDVDNYIHHALGNNEEGSVINFHQFGLRSMNNYGLIIPLSYIERSRVFHYNPNRIVGGLYSLKFGKVLKEHLFYYIHANQSPDACSDRRQQAGNPDRSAAINKIKAESELGLNALLHLKEYRGLTSRFRRFILRSSSTNEHA